MKILVTGNAGAGKSTLAAQLGQLLNLSVISLDSVVWQPGWKKTPSTECESHIARLIENPSWVIDGVSSTVMTAADIIVFLDVPRRKCLWRAMNRNRKYLFSSRPELPNRCPEILIVPTLLKIIWRFDTRVKPLILEQKERRSDRPSTFIHVTSDADIQRIQALLQAEKSR
jgi:adenylate kinase family enzyme